jgi:transcriptional regulator with GAF, ATPase, and Fis domain
MVKKRALPRVLLSFAGFHDPFAEGAVSGTQQEGPVLRLVRMHPADTVVLFSNPETAELAEQTRDALVERHPNLEVDVRHLELDDPTNYFKILKALRTEFEELSKKLGRVEYLIGAASGTPQMHACWVLLAASGEIPARILQVRPPQYVTEALTAVNELDLSRPEFPTIRSKLWANVELDEEDEKDPSVVIERLGIVGDHPEMVRALETASLLARSDVPVLVFGESGTGKEKIAGFIHQLSERAGKAFVAVNCASVPTQLAESILFGHVKGAFTGATMSSEGKFAAADGGTLFLDEVGELSTEVQAKLLRAVQDGVIEPLGSRASSKGDVRLVAATNCDLKEAVSKGEFRDDLYYRLSVGEVRLPPLRARRSDITKLALHFLDEINHRMRKPKRFAPETLGALQTNGWPGNVRELQNVVQRSALLCRKKEIGPSDLKMDEVGEPPSMGGCPEPYEGFSLDEHLKGIRRQLFERALKIADGNQSRAARLLGVSPQAVFKFLKEK